MIRFVENQDIVKKKWDKCIAFSVNERFYAYSWFLDIAAPGWDALILDDYQAVFPVLKAKKFGVTYVFQPFFTQQLGLFTPLLISTDLVESFLHKLFELFPFVEINLNAHNKVNYSHKYADSKINYELDLISPYSLLKKNYSSNTKRNLKKAHKASLSIFKNIRPELVTQLFRNDKGKTLKVYTNNDYLKFNQLAYKAIEKGKAEVWGAYSQQNTLLASAIFFADNKRFTFLFSGNSNEGRENAAMFYLIDSFIESKAGTNMILDFEGSSDKNLARFYGSFGAQLVKYPKIYSNRLPFYLKATLLLYKTIKPWL